MTLWITTNCGKFLKWWEYQKTLPASWETCMQVKMRHLELDKEQQTGSKLGKEYVKAAYCHPAYLTSIREYHAKCWAGWSTVRIAKRNINNLRYADDTTLMAESKEELKRLLMNEREKSDKLTYNSKFKKLRSWNLVPSLNGK